MFRKQLNASTKDNLSSLSPLGDRELRFDLKYPGFIYKKFFSSQATSLKLQAGGGGGDPADERASLASVGVGGPIARKPQVSSTLFYFFSYLWDFL